jgi:hypothetical protein
MRGRSASRAEEQAWKFSVVVLSEHGVPIT